MSLLTPVKRNRKVQGNKPVNIVSPDGKIKKETHDLSVQTIEPTVTGGIKEPASATVVPQKEGKSVEVNNQVKQVYKIIQKCTGATGGNGYNGAIYGELTAGSMQKVINFMVESCELNGHSCFIDVGAGLGKPNFHVLQSPQVKLSIGVELEEIRWILSLHNLNSYLKRLRKEMDKSDDKNLVLNHYVNFICADIDRAHSLDPFTHIYMYDLGFPPDLQKNIAKKFNNSIASRFLISYRPPRRVTEEYGYEVEAMHQLNTKMFGSGESHMCYFYKRIGKIPKSPILPRQRKIILPQSDEESLKEIAVKEGAGAGETVDTYTDELFADAIERVKDFFEFQNHVESMVENHLNSARTTRAHKK